MVMSAVSSVSTPGVLVTVMPRCSAVATSILSTPLPKLAISLSCSPAWLEHARGRSVGDGRHQHVGGLDRLGELGLAHRLVVEVEPRVEQLAHARLDAVGQLARDDDQRLLAVAIRCPLRRSRTARAPFCACERAIGTKRLCRVRRSGLFNRASPTLSRRGGTSIVSLADGRAHDKARRVAGAAVTIDLGVQRVALRRSGLMIVGRAGRACGRSRAARRSRQARAGSDAATSGLPVPRFVSLKADRVNVRGGPDKDHDVAWVYHARRPAGRDHRRVRELAAHPRLRRRRRLGLPLAAVGQAHRAWCTLEGEERSARRSTPSPTRTARVTARAAVRRARHGQALRRDGWCRFAGDGFDGWIAAGAAVGRLSEREGGVGRAFRITANGRGPQ